MINKSENVSPEVYNMMHSLYEIGMTNTGVLVTNQDKFAMIDKLEGQSQIASEQNITSLVSIYLIVINQ